MLTAPGIAQADFSECNNQWVCIWDDNDFKDLLKERESGGGLWNIQEYRNDRMDSWANRNDSRWAAWYHGYDGTGDCNPMPERSNDGNINVFDSDELSSWRTNGGCQV